IVAVIGRQDDQVVLPHAGLEPRDPRVQLEQSLMKPRDVVAVPPALIEFDHVHEDEPLGERVQRRFDAPVGVGVRGRVLARDVATREQVVHLADADAGDAPFRQEIEQRLPHRLEREVAAVRGARVRPGRRPNSASSSRGKPWGYVRNARSSSTPQISQWPVVLSFPWDAGSATPYAAAGLTPGESPGMLRHNPSPSRSRLGSFNPPTARATLPRVSLPTSP